MEINQNVQLALSGELGVIIGKATYRDLPDSYLVRYVAADGRQVQDWFENSAIEPTVED
jgi:hypothetical protein